MKNRKIVISLVGVLIMLLLIISATYAYFSVTITGNGSKTMITANTPKKHSLSVSTLYDDIHIHVDNNDMKLANVGSYYGAVNDNRYEKTKEDGTHNIIEVSSKGMENIRYSCSGDIKVTLNIDDGSMGSVLEKEDVLLYLKGLGLDETLDLSTLKMNNTKIYNTSFEIDGDSSDYLSAIVELINKESYQNYIANKILNVKIEAENMVCRENGTYKYMVALYKSVTEKQNDRESVKTVSIFYDEEGMYQKIQNIYLVDYIDTTKAIKTWDLGDTNRGTKSNEVMGWLEETPDIEDSYDLYIGADGPMRAPQDMRFAFYQFTNLKSITGDVLDTSEVMAMENLFRQNTNLTDISALSNWDVSSVITMGSMFLDCTNLNDISALSGWNVPNLTTMQGMFRNCRSLTNIDALKNWNPRKLTNMRELFYDCRNLTDISALSSWDVSKVNNMNTLFYYCTNLTDISVLNNWNTSKVTNMSNMFAITKITDLSPITNWDVSQVIYFNNIFASTQISDLTPIKDWDVSTAQNMGGMFKGTNIVDLIGLENWKFPNATDLSWMFDGCKTLVDLSAISNWDMSKVTNISWMFDGCSNLTDLRPIAGWNISSAIYMNGMFAYCRSLSDLTPLSKWDVSKVTETQSMFFQTLLNDLTPFSDWNIESITNMTAMFASIPIDDLTPLSNWNVSNVENFGDNKQGGMFGNCRNLIKADLSNWNTPKLVNIAKMFGGCTKLVELKLPKAPYNAITIEEKYIDIFASVPKNITVYTESSQMDWVKARLQEALGENNNSTVLPYE